MSDAVSRELNGAVIGVAIARWSCFLDDVAVLDRAAREDFRRRLFEIDNIFMLSSLRHGATIISSSGTIVYGVARDTWERIMMSWFTVVVQSEQSDDESVRGESWEKDEEA